MSRRTPRVVMPRAEIGSMGHHEAPSTDRLDENGRPL
jgi:hypothetical protein